MRILFRVDASASIGMGHLRRTLALATAMAKRGHEPMFLIHDGGDVLPIEPPFPRVQEIGGGWDLAVVDSYVIADKEYGLIRSQSKKTAVISDGTDRGFACDAIIDQNLYAHPAMYASRAATRTRLLLGPSYAMIREEIVQARSEGFRVSLAVRKILLTFGGGEQHENLLRMLQWISRLCRDVEISILTPRPVSLDIHTGVAAGSSSPSNQYRVVHGQPHVGSLMRQSDIAVSGAGVTSLELACIGVPALHVVLADNQLRGAQAAQELGIGLNLGPPASWSLDNAGALLRRLESPSLRQTMSLKGCQLVDGEGSHRLAQALEELI